MTRRVRAPFVTTVASVVIAGAAFGTNACGPNPPSAEDCPLDTPTSGDKCYGSSSCYYDTAGCEGSLSNWTHASCNDGKWLVRQEGASCNPPNPMPDASPVETAVEAGACPTNEPAIGSACSASAICSYQNLCPQTSAIKSNTYRCSGGKWTFDSTLESPIECPKTEPRNGEACGCAMYLPSKCTYAGTCGSDEAVCDGATQRWIVKAPICADAGGGDAPSDAPASDAPASDAPASETTPSADAAAETASDAAAD